MTGLALAGAVVAYTGFAFLVARCMGINDMPASKAPRWRLSANGGIVRYNVTEDAAE